MEGLNISNVKGVNVKIAACNTSKNAKAEVGDVLGAKQSGIQDRETKDKIISMTTDNMNKLNVASVDTNGALEQLSIYSNMKNDHVSFSETIEAQVDCFSSVGIQIQEDNKNGENEVEALTDNYKELNETSPNLVVPWENVIRSTDVSYAKETGERITACRQPDNTKCKNARNMRKWPMFYFDENGEMANINWIEGSHFNFNTLENAKAEVEEVLDAKQSGINDRETGGKMNSMINVNMNQMNAASDDINDGLEQQSTSSNMKTVRFSFFEKVDVQYGSFSPLEIQTQETNKSGDNEVTIRTNSYKDEVKDKNYSSFVIVPENSNIKSGEVDAYSCQNQIFVKDEINVEENRFASDLFSKTYVINDRLEKENGSKNNNGIFNLQNINSNTTSTEDKKLKYIINTNGETLYPVINRFENNPINLEKYHEEDIKDMISKDRTYDSISLNSAKKEQLVEAENDGTYLFHETKNSTPVDLISWDIPYEKPAPKAIQKESQKYSDKFKPDKDNSLQKVHNSMICSENKNILLELEKKHLENASDVMSNKSMFNYNHAFINTTNNEVIVNKGETYNANVFDETRSSAAMNHFSWVIPNEKIESQINKEENENISCKPDKNIKGISENYHRESIAKEGEINNRYDKNASEKQNDTQGNNALKNDLNTSQNGFIRVTSPEFSKLVKSKDDLLDKIPSMNLNLNEISEDVLNASQNAFINELKPKTSKFEKVSGSPKQSLKAVNCDSERTKYEQMKNGCTNNNNLHNGMIFGHCPKCVPIQSAKTIKETRATRLAPKVPFDRNGDTCRRYRKSCLKPYTSFKNSANAMRKEKRVTFTEDNVIFSYDPKKSIREAIYNYISGNEKVKDTSSKVSGTLSKIEKSTKINDTSTKFEVNHSKIREAALKGKKSLMEAKEPSCYETGNENLKHTLPGIIPKTKQKATKGEDKSTKMKVKCSKTQETASECIESLEVVLEPLYYDNMGFIDDWQPYCPSKIDLGDDPLITFENDEVGFCEKSCLTDSKSSRRYTEKAAKKWLKNASSMTFKKLSLKKKGR